MVMEEAMKMANGQCQDMEEYDHKVGYIRGLRHAAEAAEQLAKRSESDDEPGDGLVDIDGPRLRRKP
jgi:hypothetical protein